MKIQIEITEDKKRIARLVETIPAKDLIDLLEKLFGAEWELVEIQPVERIEWINPRPITIPDLPITPNPYPSPHTPWYEYTTGDHTGDVNKIPGIYSLDVTFK